MYTTKSKCQASAVILETVPEKNNAIALIMPHSPNKKNKGVKTTDMPIASHRKPKRIWLTAMTEIMTFLSI
jgi:hypothetical protein